MINREAAYYIKRAIRTGGVSPKLEELRGHHPPSLVHSFIVSYTTAQIGLIAGYSPSDIKFAVLCALLHDVGKYRIPEAILSSPKKLTTKERYTINHHPRHGHNILVGFDRDVATVAAAHHEPFIDGYPRKERRSNQDGLRHTIESVGLVDVIAALTEPPRIRPYRGIPFTPTETIGLLKEKFTGDPTLIDVAERLMAMRKTRLQL
ncbi:MAG: HD domain-containing phosphohydrolase [Nanoarchaeota archaeon]